VRQLFLGNWPEENPLDKLEAEGFLRKVQAQYPNAFATNDYINPPPIE
jgi:hypothetical protein